jgi:hypothetical protein
VTVAGKWQADVETWGNFVNLVTVSMVKRHQSERIKVIVEPDRAFRGFQLVARCGRPLTRDFCPMSPRIGPKRHADWRCGLRGSEQMTVLSGLAGGKGHVGEAKAGGSALRARSPGGVYSAPETTLLVLVLATFCAAFAMSFVRNQAVDWWGFVPGLAPGFLLIATGGYSRYRGTMPRLSLYMIGIGVFLSFMCASAIFVYMLFPLTAPSIDPFLSNADQAFGYSWPDFVASLATVPSIGKALSYVYLSSIWQLFLVITLLAWLNRTTDLHRFLSVGILGLGIASLIWWMAPSFGPAAFHDVPPEVAARISLVVDSAYGAELRRLGAEGTAIITPDVVMGVIAFPSFHMIMACMVVWFSRRTPFFLPLLVLNTAMIPAILAHGGHYLVDLFGGIAVFALSVWISTRIAPRAQVADRIAP